MPEEKEQGLSVILAGSVAVDLGSTKLHAAPLRLEDYRDFESFVRSQRLAVLLRGYRLLEPLSVAERQEKAAAIDRATTAALSPVEFISEMTSVEGGLYAMWLSFRQNHPDLTLSRLTELVKDNRDVIDLVLRISGLAKETEKKEGENSPPAVAAQSAGT